jgi:hypothetical protein
MAKKARATFQKRAKEKARQQKQQDKAQRRVEAKARRAASGPRLDGDEAEVADMRPGPHVLPAQWEEAHPSSRGREGMLCALETTGGTAGESTQEETGRPGRVENAGT